MQLSPFKFSQACSCKLGNRIPNCHLACYVASSQALGIEDCTEVPTLCATSQGATDSLGGILCHLTASVLARVPARKTLCPPAYVEAETLKHTSGAQHAPDSQPDCRAADSNEAGSSGDPAQPSFPTDAKEREKERRKLEKEQGIEHKVVKRKKIMEDHYDDCGDDLSSKSEVETTASIPCGEFLLRV